MKMYESQLLDFKEQIKILQEHFGELKDLNNLRNLVINVYSAVTCL